MNPRPVFLSIVVLVLLALVLYLLLLWHYKHTKATLEAGSFGCSVPKFVTDLSRKLDQDDAIGQSSQFFYPACVGHDYCYRCGSCTYGLSRKQCDEQFRTDMLARCKTSAVGYGRCAFRANWFYRMVRWFGQPHCKNGDQCIHFSYRDTT